MHSNKSNRNRVCEHRHHQMRESERAKAEKNSTNSKKFIRFHYEWHNILRFQLSKHLHAEHIRSLDSFSLLTHTKLVCVENLRTIESIENVTCKLVNIFFSFIRSILIDEFPIRSGIIIVHLLFEQKVFVLSTLLAFRNLNTPPRDIRTSTPKKNLLVVTLSNLRLTNHNILDDGGGRELMAKKSAKIFFHIRFVVSFVRFHVFIFVR